MATLTKIPVEKFKYVLELDETEAKVVAALTGKLVGHESDSEYKAASARIFSALSEKVDYWKAYDALLITPDHSLKFKR